MPNASVMHAADFSPRRASFAYSIEHVRARARAEDRRDSLRDGLDGRRHLAMASTSSAERPSSCWRRGRLLCDPPSSPRSSPASASSFRAGRHVRAPYPVADVRLAVNPPSEMFVEPVHTSVGFCSLPFSKTMNLLCWMSSASAPAGCTRLRDAWLCLIAPVLSSRGKLGCEHAILCRAPVHLGVDDELHVDTAVDRRLRSASATGW